MKKIIYLLLLATSCFSQDKKFSVIGSIGSSIPIGQFGSISSGVSADSKGNQYPKCGFAKLGVNANIGLDYYFTKHFGVAAAYSYSRSEVSTEIKKAYSQIVYNNGFGGSNGEMYSNLISTPWQNKFMMIGPTFRTSISKLYLSGSVQAGLCNTTTPHQSFSENHPSTSSVSYDRHEQKINSLAFGASVSLCYSISESVSILLNINSLNSSYKDQTINYDFNSGSYSFEESRKINILTTAIGLAYNF